MERERERRWWWWWSNRENVENRNSFPLLNPSTTCHDHDRSASQEACKHVVSSVCRILIQVWTLSNRLLPGATGFTWMQVRGKRFKPWFEYNAGCLLELNIIAFIPLFFFPLAHLSSKPRVVVEAPSRTSR